MNKNVFYVISVPKIQYLPLTPDLHNSREKGRDAELIVDMKGNTTYLRDPENPGEEPRNFSFDYSYWSFDGCKKMPDGYFGPDTGHPNGKKFCDQVWILWI